MPDLKVRVGGAWQSVTTTGPAGPPGAGGGAHHLTHEVGGSDPITGALAITTLTTSGTVTTGADVILAANASIRRNTVDGADNGVVALTGGGAASPVRGAAVLAFGNEAVGNEGRLTLGAGQAAVGRIDFSTNNAQVGTMWPSGGFSWGSTTDPGANNFTVAGGARFCGGVMPATGPTAVEVTVAGTDGYINAYDRTAALYRPLNLYGQDLTFFASAIRGKMHSSGGFQWGSTFADPGGGTDPGLGNLGIGGKLKLSGQGAVINAQGTPSDTFARYAEFMTGYGVMYMGVDNSAGSQFTGVSGCPFMYSTTHLSLVAANPAGTIKFQTGGGGLIKGTMFASGGFSWGATPDPGAGSLGVATSVLVGQAASVGNSWGYLGVGAMSLGINTAVASTVVAFYNPNGAVGSIVTSGSSTIYNATSDARLKTDRGRLTDTTVLEQTIVHAFDWKNDGSAGRGVFAQEAAAVAPFAVTVGNDDLDEQGRLKNPWCVDYSKYVPDLIVGWQAHDAKVAALEAKIAKLEAMIEKLLT